MLEREEVEGGRWGFRRGWVAAISAARDWGSLLGEQKLHLQMNSRDKSHNFSGLSRSYRRSWQLVPSRFWNAYRFTSEYMSFFLIHAVVCPPSAFTSMSCSLLLFYSFESAEQRFPRNVMYNFVLMVGWKIIFILYLIHSHIEVDNSEKEILRVESWFSTHLQFYRTGAEKSTFRTENDTEKANFRSTANKK